MPNFLTIEEVGAKARERAAWVTTVLPGGAFQGARTPDVYLVEDVPDATAEQASAYMLAFYPAYNKGVVSARRRV